MIKPLNTTQLSSAKPRGGLQNISDLPPSCSSNTNCRLKRNARLKTTIAFAAVGGLDGLQRRTSKGHLRGISKVLDRGRMS